MTLADVSIVMSQEFNPSDFFAKEHFQTIKIVFLEGSNNTTRTQFKPIDIVNMTEFSTKSFVAEVPLNSCSKGHNLEFKIQISIPREKQIQQEVFAVTCQVKEKTTLDNGMDQITVELLQYEERYWGLLQNAVENRQQEIMAFFKAAKG